MVSELPQCGILHMYKPRRITVLIVGLAVGLAIPTVGFYDCWKYRLTPSPPADNVGSEMRLAFLMCKTIWERTAVWPKSFEQVRDQENPLADLSTIQVNSGAGGGSIRLHLVSEAGMSGSQAVKDVLLETDYFVLKGQPGIRKYIIMKNGELIRLVGGK